MRNPDLRETLREADGKHIGLAHFNVSELTALRAAVETARELGLPVIIGASEGERQFIGVRQIAALVQSYRQAEGPPIFLNADHTHTLDGVREAAANGFDMIVFDASRLPIGENIAATREAIAAARSINPSIVMEGEIGYIGASSSVHDQPDRDVGALTTPEEAREFVQATGIDILAPSVGTTHGMLASMVHAGERKHLDLQRIAGIRKTAGVFLTLHGGSGTADADFVAAIRAGITIIHINTELRVAWHDGLQEALRNEPGEVVPYKLLKKPLERVAAVVRSRMQLFASAAASA